MKSLTSIIYLLACAAFIFTSCSEEQIDAFQNRGNSNVEDILGEWQVESTSSNTRIERLQYINDTLASHTISTNVSTQTNNSFTAIATSENLKDNTKSIRTTLYDLYVESYTFLPDNKLQRTIEQGIRTTIITDFDRDGNLTRNDTTMGTETFNTTLVDVFKYSDDGIPSLEIGVMHHLAELNNDEMVLILEDATENANFDLNATSIFKEDVERRVTLKR